MRVSGLSKMPIVAIYGVGLIGGSLALALKRSGFSDYIIGVGRSCANLETAKSIGAIDEIQPDSLKATSDADIIVLATPVNAISTLMREIAPAVTEDKTVTDVGSVKSGIVDAARTEFGSRFSRFVPGHPIAGKEMSGIGAAQPELFENHKIILTPVHETSHEACTVIEQMWRATGGEVKLMDVDDHDRVLSITSHLPHVLAYVMMDFLSTSTDRKNCYEMAAGGFYDFTRTASSDPEMWRDICLMNKTRILNHISEFQNQLGRVGDMIEQGDGKGIEDLFASAKQARSLVTEKRKHSS